jgi:crossover junction endodeoxyribonuclease RuvC
MVPVSGSNEDCTRGLQPAPHSRSLLYTRPLTFTPHTTVRIKEERQIPDQERCEMIVIGIDPGLARVGYGVIAVRDRKSEPVCYGCIETSGDQSTSGRLVRIYTEVAALLEKYPPAHIAVEKLFFTRNITSAMSVSEARGVILLLAEQQKIPVTEYTPNQVKQAITGSGRADKRQMQEMIMRLLHLPGIPRPDDAADALSIALCHIHILR